ncbi:MAG: hypothetical protein FWG07_08580 [Treponema sp.]|nr:hypothetical protein [Treponema sp.]
MIKPGLLCALALICSGLFAQEQRLVLHITSSVGSSTQDSWNTFTSKVTIPGRGVEIKLVNDNLTITVQFTPHFRQDKYTLIAQSEILINIPEKGMSYKTDTRSLPIELGDSIVYLLPLSSENAPDNPRIELYLTMYRYGEEPAIEVGSENPTTSLPPTDTTGGNQPRREDRREAGQREGSRSGGRNR